MWRRVSLKSGQNFCGTRERSIICEKRGEGELPFAHGVGRAAGFRRDDGKAVVHVGAGGVQLQRVLIIGNGAGIFGELEVRLGAAGRRFHHRGQVVFRAGLLDRDEIFAVAAAVVKPFIAGELLSRDRSVCRCARRRSWGREFR